MKLASDGPPGSSASAARRRPQRLRERASRPRLDRGLGADQQRALLPRVAREQLQRIGERRVRRLELARAEQRVGPRLQQLDALERQVSVVGEQPQRALEVARGARRRLPEHALGGVGEQVDGGAVAALGGVLDVMRALHRPRAAALERGGRAGVRPQSPGAGGGGVDGVADQRVPEGEPPRRRGGADQRAAQATRPAPPA